MRVVAYLRVSTARQAEEGLGLQREALTQWANAEGHQLIAFCSDEGISGSNGLDTRLGLADAFSLLKEGWAEGMVVYRLDRLARDLVLQEQLLAETRRLGAQAFSASAGESQFLADDPNDPSRALIRQVLGAVAEFERATIRMRLRAGKARKAAHGGYIGGKPPYGYRAEKRELVPHELEQQTISRMRELRERGLSLDRIANTLNSEGLRPRSAKKWSKGPLSTLLGRECRAMSEDFGSGR